MAFSYRIFSVYFK